MHTHIYVVLIIDNFILYLGILIQPAESRKNKFVLAENDIKDGL